MENDKTDGFACHIDWLLSLIEAFLEANPTLKPCTFGWHACRDSDLVERLRRGGDVTTRKMDEILAYLSNPN